MREIVVEFDRSVQSIGALREAAYRIMRQASCQIEAVGERYRCRLITKENGGEPLDEGMLRSAFLDLVTDENLREKVAAETGPVRDVILALAFGSLAAGRNAPEQNGGGRASRPCQPLRRLQPTIFNCCPCGSSG
jgi:His-Xaa-Ser system protein HxsD